jgi:predicted nucleic acid-binding protein
MIRIVLLDSGPLGLATNPRVTPENRVCNAWIQSLLARGDRVIVPEIIDYEVRRELLRSNKLRGIQRLDHFCAVLEYLPLTTVAMHRAAEYWAQTRQQGRPTADDRSLDGDVILAAQASTMGEPGVIIATANVGHLARFVTAEEWRNIL